MSKNIQAVEETPNIKKVNIDDLTLGDDYLFATVMQNKELCKKLIERLLEIPDIKDIEYIGVEENYKHSYASRGVRFDVFVKDQTDVAYVVEMQTTDTKELERRSRYYQSMIDSKQLKKGKKYSYKNLKDSYVIFICREDIFGNEQYRYSFENTCSEVAALKLNDGTYKIFFNTKGVYGNVSDDVKAFLQSIEGIKTDNAFANEFKTQADEIKSNETWRESYMQSLLRDQDKFDAGIEQGIEQSIEQTILILRELSTDEKLIATKIKEKFQLSDEDVKKYLNS